MRYRIAPAATLLAALALAACSGRDTVLAPVAPPAPRGDVATAVAPPTVYFSEIHYDNVGADADERIEITGPAGTDLTGWQVVLYNGNGGVTYNTQTLSGTIPATCGANGVVVLTYPADGIQNGSPDGMALVNGGGQVVEFLSYEGTFAATNGPALGMTSVDIGVLENGAPVGQSLQRSSAGTWSGPVASTFGACNDDGGQPPAAVAKVTVAPAAASIAQGATQTFTATAFDASNQPVAGVTFTWTSSATAVATVSATGVATALQPGDVTITATAPNAITGTASLHVDRAVDAGPARNAVQRAALRQLRHGRRRSDRDRRTRGHRSLTGWSIVLYNGNGGVQYNTQPLTRNDPRDVRRPRCRRRELPAGRDPERQPRRNGTGERGR